MFLMSKWIALKKKIDQIDESMDLVTLINEQINEIEQKVDSGLLTRTQGNRLIEEINDTYRRELARLANINPARSLPQWAVELGLTTPNELILDPDFFKFLPVLIIPMMDIIPLSWFTTGVMKNRCRRPNVLLKKQIFL